ncbi:type I restriction-modification system subunit M [Aliamphritea hakodatensis]|uniref:type I restriction-modification system subunit M n=1 Tax=Aliamphritea hakodatensis TaxID=2895352 RepID=UPI0022FD3B0F|nr:type I restriction-modification system subunit M [Aliamphritea hakodatensis]
MVEQHKKNLEKQLWNIANALRGNMAADDFRDYILGFIFYKYLSEKIHLYADDILQADGFRFEELDEESKQGQELLEAVKEEAIDHLGYFLKPSELFHVIAERGENGEFIIESLTEVLRHIEQSTMGSESEDDFNGLFDDLDLTSNKLGKTEKAKNELITKVLTHLDAIDFALEDTEIDVLGDAYEYLIGQFASGAGKKAGEFYTPQMVSKLLAQIVTHGRDDIRSVYDPTCGSGSLLLRVARELSGRKNGAELSKNLQYFGQESNPSTYNLARMNMILHDVHYSRFDIQQDDTLEDPHHTDKRFDAVVANPPFSAKWSAAAGHLTDERFQDYGKLAPASKADFAFVQHMYHQLDENGTLAVVLPHGVLFRGAAEGHIRKFFIEQHNALDAVIGLPANVFFGTGIPTCILVLKKNRKNTENIFFIDASANFGKATNQNYLRDEDLDQIIDAYTQRQNIDKFAFVAPIKSQQDENGELLEDTALSGIESSIEDNDYNLNIPRYVDTFEGEEPVDLAVVAQAISEIETELDGVDKQLADFCKQLGIQTP